MGSIGVGYHQFSGEEDVEKVLGKDYKDWAQTFNSTNPTYEEGQWDALKLYTIADKNYFNDDLRSGKNIGELSEYQQNIVKKLDTAIDRFDLSVPIRTFRQVRFGSKVEQLLINKNGELQVPLGKVITDKGYMSTTLNRGEAGHIITNGTNDNSYIMDIQVPKGRGVGALLGNASSRPYEAEFLMSRNTKYKVIGKAYKDTNGYWVVPVQIVRSK